MSEAYRITAALRGTWSGGRGMACCPAHEDRTPSLSLADGANGCLLLHCHAGCAFADILAALREHGVLSGTGAVRGSKAFQPVERPASELAEKVRRSRQAQALWSDTTVITGSSAEAYLRARGITCALPDSLRFAARCWHKSAKRLPAMVAQVTSEAQDVPCFAVHRTYLKADGIGKADAAPAKAMLGPVAGGAVRLSNAPGPLVVTEGIETGLSLLSGLLPGPARVWAALSAGGMARLHLPDAPGHLIVAGDGDPVGRDAAETLATRAHALGWRVSLMVPPDGADWNDVLTGKAVAA